MLVVEDLRVYYGAIEALRGVSFSINSGEVVVIIGSNGAGKSTTLKAIAGLIRPVQGSIRFKEQQIARMPAHQIVSLGITLIPEGRKIFANQTVWDNLMLGAYRRLKADLQQEAEAQLGRFPILRERRRQAAGSLSGGQQQMLAIARALMAHPKLLLMDEPSIGLAPLLVRQVFAIIEQLRQEGITILLVEQMANLALSIADRGYVLEQGQIIMEGTGRDLLKDPKVKTAYLGTIRQEY